MGVYTFAETDRRPRLWIDDFERADIAARLRLVAGLLERSTEDELSETLDLARATLARELERLS